MKKQVHDWMLLADQDLKVSEIIMRDDEPLTNIVAYHCQQAIEKYLKAYLLENNVPIIKTHDLIKLNGMIKEIRDLGIDKDKLILINEVYIESRYPGDLGLLPNGIPSNEDAEKFIEYAKEIKAIILNELNSDDDN